MSQPEKSSENCPEFPFSLRELRQHTTKLDDYVKFAAVAVMQNEMGPDDLGCPSTVVDELAHLHGLLDLARCCVSEIEQVVNNDL